MSDTSEDRRISEFFKAQEGAVLEIVDQGLITLASLVSSGAVDVSPKFQRRDRWDAEKQSLLIESFLANIPVPPVYLAEDTARLGSYAVIDGKQRLTAVSTFFADRLALRGLSRLPSLNGLRYNQLPDAIRHPLGMKSLRVTTLLRQSSEELKHEVFLRLNTGGEVLNAQEIRNVAYRGPLNDLIYTLAESRFLRQQFKITPPSSQNYRQMLDAEYVLRFFALQSNWSSFRGELRQELDRFMTKFRFADDTQLDSLRRTYESSIETCEAIRGRNSFKRPGRDQALAGLYDAEMISVSLLNSADKQLLVHNRDEYNYRLEKLFNDDEFDEAVRRGTNTPGRLRYRTKKVLELAHEVIGR